MTSRTTCAPSDRDALHVVKPRFFPGQTLSDNDLRAIVCWTEQRLRLHSTCGGWGVVCGLAVGVDPLRTSRVTVGPGYGFDREMGLCIVSEHIEADLPCATCGACGGDGEHKRTFPGSKAAYCASDLRVYDARLAVLECPQQKALAMSMDGRRHCEDTRLKTSAKLIIVPASSLAAMRESAVAFLEQLCKEKKLNDFLNDKVEWGNGSQFTLLMNEWLSKELKKWPGLQLPWPTLPQSWGKSRDEALTNLSWLAFAIRRLRACAPASRDPSIPLARIWAVCADNEQRVVWIDVSAPHHQTFHGCRPGFDLRDWLGEPLDDAMDAARRWGIDIAQQPLGDLAPESLASLREQVEAEIKLANTCRPGMKVTAHWYAAPEYVVQRGKAIPEDVRRVFAWTESQSPGDEGATEDPTVQDPLGD